MRKTILGILSCIMILSLCGCYASKEAVKLDSEKRLTIMAQKKHGPVELVETNDYDEPTRCRICELKDVKRGFTYHITSQPHSQGFDGVAFYYDGTMVTDDFQDSYKTWMTEVTRKEFEAKGFAVVDELPTYRPYDLGFDRVVCVNELKLLTTQDHLEEDVQFVVRTMYAHDSELAFKRDELRVYLGSDMEFFGDIAFDEVLHEDKGGMFYMKKQVKEICGIGIDSFDKIDYIRLENIPGIEDQKVDLTGIDESKIVNIYYFTYEGKQYFICEAKVYQNSGKKGGEVLQYFQNYTDYEPARN